MKRQKVIDALAAALNDDDEAVLASLVGTAIEREEYDRQSSDDMQDCWSKYIEPEARPSTLQRARLAI